MQSVSDHTPLRPHSVPGGKKSAAGYEVNQDYLLHPLLQEALTESMVVRSLAIPVWTPEHKAQINNAAVTCPREHHGRDDYRS